MGNPLADKISDSGSYRTLVRETIPHLKVLDEVPFEGVDVSSLSSVSSYSLMSASMVNVWRDVNKGLISPMSAQDKGTWRSILHINVCTMYIFHLLITYRYIYIYT